jgi:hypothetical protein
MKVKPALLFCAALLCLLCNLQAQGPIEVSKPSLSLEDGKVRIDYSLLNADESGKYTVRIEVTGQKGDRIPARSLSGDIGKGISGRGNKTIFWDLQADNIFLDEEIFVEVFALPEETRAVKEELTQTPPGEEEGKTAATDTGQQKELNRTVLIIESLAVPGLGLSRLHPGQPHWLRGVAAYGCLAGSVYFNRKSWNTYQQYQEPPSLDEVQDLFDQAYDQKKRSRLLGYAAVGVWAVDLVWTVVGTSKMNEGSRTGKNRGLSFEPSFDQLSGAPLLTMRYRF